MSLLPLINRLARAVADATEPHTYRCPACTHLLEEGTPRCPHCQTSLSWYP